METFFLLSCSVIFSKLSYKKRLSERDGTRADTDLSWAEELEAEPEGRG